jgi:hypothetical protein
LKPYRHFALKIDSDVGDCSLRKLVTRQLLSQEFDYIFGRARDWLGNVHECVFIVCKYMWKVYDRDLITRRGKDDLMVKFDVDIKFGQ